MKTCACCKNIKPFSEFHRSKKRKDGHHPYCKTCRKLKELNNLKTKTYKRLWYLENKKSCIEKEKIRYKEKQQEIKAYKKKHYENNKDYIKSKSSNYYHLHKNDENYREKRRLSVNLWKKKNKHIVAWRSLLHTTLKKLKQTKSNNTKNLLGYSADELKLHLENNWLPGMNWENYGEWHIDHIRPVYSFPKDTLACVVNDLNNLRPLWAVTKIVNGKKVIGNLNRSKK